MKYTTDITLYNSYFDVNSRLTAKSILTIFQNVASFHAEKLGVGFKAMFEKNLYWVLTRIKFDIIKMPEINQTVTVETWPHEKGKIDFDRDIKILSKDGETLVIGTSKWCVIDVANRRLQRTDNVNYTLSEHCLDVNYVEKFNKITLPNEIFTKRLSYTVQFSDLDQNKHMNNTHYANLICKVIQNKIYNHFEINFINECKENETVNISTCRLENEEFISASVNEKIAFTALVK